MIVKILIILIGLVLIGGSFLAVAMRRMSSAAGCFWAVLGAIPAIAGLLGGGEDSSGVMTYLWLLYLVSAVVLGGLFTVTMCLFTLTEKNRELAMQVSLLNQENEQILKEIAARKNDGGEKAGA